MSELRYASPAGGSWVDGPGAAAPDWPSSAPTIAKIVLRREKKKRANRCWGILLSGRPKIPATRHLRSSKETMTLVF